MKVGILSDTHSTWDDRYAEYFASCDEIWHAGDIGDLRVIEKLRQIAPVRAVSGNIDGSDLRAECPTELFFEAAGATVFLRHIVGRPGRYAPGIPARLRSLHPRIVVAGHSHILVVKYDPLYDTLFINPGAAGTYGQQTVRTLLRLTITNGTPADLEVMELASRNR